MAILDNRSKITPKVQQVIVRTISLSNIMTIAFLALILFVHKNPTWHHAILEANGIIATYVITPIQSYFKSLQVLALNASHFSDLHEENLQLRVEIEELKALQLKYEIAMIENEKMANHLKLVGKLEYNAVTARLLYIAHSDDGNIALISAGRKDNIAVNNIVISNDCLFGRVIEVSEHFAKVLLLSDYNSRVPVQSSVTGVKAILVGDKNNHVKLTHLPLDHHIQEGEILLTSGDGKYYPPNIPVARINDTKTNNVSGSIFSDYINTEFVTILKISGTED